MFQILLKNHSKPFDLTKLAQLPKFSRACASNFMKKKEENIFQELFSHIDVRKFIEIIINYFHFLKLCGKLKLNFRSKSIQIKAIIIFGDLPLIKKSFFKYCKSERIDFSRSKHKIQSLQFFTAFNQLNDTLSVNISFTS